MHWSRVGRVGPIFRYIHDRAPPVIASRTLGRDIGTRAIEISMISQAALETNNEWMDGRVAGSESLSLFLSVSLCYYTYELYRCN